MNAYREKKSAGLLDEQCSGPDRQVADNELLNTCPAGYEHFFTDRDVPCCRRTGGLSSVPLELSPQAPPAPSSPGRSTSQRVESKLPLPTPVFKRNIIRQLPATHKFSVGWPLNDPSIKDDLERQATDLARVQTAYEIYREHPEWYTSECSEPGEYYSDTPEAGEEKACREGYSAEFSMHDLVCCRPKVKREERVFAPSVLYTKPGIKGKRGRSEYEESLPTTTRVDIGPGRQRLEDLAALKRAAEEVDRLRNVRPRM